MAVSEKGRKQRGAGEEGLSSTRGCAGWYRKLDSAKLTSKALCRKSAKSVAKKENENHSQEYYCDLFLLRNMRPHETGLQIVVYIGPKANSCLVS